MKKIIPAILILFTLLSSFNFTGMAEEEITVMVNGEKLVNDVPAQTVKVVDESGNYIGDRTMLPIRAISEKLNCDVFWNEETEGITIYRKYNIYTMWLGKDTAFHLYGMTLEKSYKMDTPPQTINGRTLVPVRAVAELLGATVNWIEKTNTVDIKCELGEVENNEGIAKENSLAEVLLKTNYELYSNFMSGNSKTITGKFVMKNGKEMPFELYPDIAPFTCSQFVALAKEGFYDNTIFHRVIKDFVAQGGGFTVDGINKPTQNVPGEFLANGWFNLISHKKGVLSLARANEYNSGSSQFFICHKDTPYLDGGYAAFGKLTGGFDCLDEICSSETDDTDKPITDIVLSKVIIND